MKVAMLTTTGPRCGIAAYTRALVAGFDAVADTDIEVVPIEEGKQPLEHYIEQAKILNAPDVDVVHIQHEHCFWGGVLPRTSAYWDMRYLIKKPVVLTAHTTTALSDLLKLKQERRPHKWLVKQLLLRNQGYRDSVEIAPFSTAMTIVHTSGGAERIDCAGSQAGLRVYRADGRSRAPSRAHRRAGVPRAFRSAQSAYCHDFWLHHAQQRV